jgi:hypothetical protein
MALSTSVILGFFTKMFPILAGWGSAGGGVGEEEGKVDWTGTRRPRQLNRGRVCWPCRAPVGPTAIDSKLLFERSLCLYEI